MPNAMWLFVPSASPSSSYVVQNGNSGDPSQSRRLGDSIIMAGAHDDRPAAGTDYDGCVYFETDTAQGTLFRCDGVSWTQIAAAIHPSQLKISGAFALEGAASPAQLTADQNDYNPSGLSGAVALRLTSDASRALTGLAGGEAGRVLIVENVGSNPIVLRSESGFSTAANRFAIGADLTLTVAQACLLWYDATSSRWRLVSSAGGAPTDAAYVTTSANGKLSNEQVLGSAVIMAGAVGSRPAAATAGLLYWATDENILYRDGGSSWVKIGTLDLADMTNRAHVDLTGIGANDHHNQSHDHSAGGDGTSLLPATLTIPSSTSPAQTAEGSAVWDSDDDRLTVGTGSGRKTLVNDDDSRLTDARTPTAHATSHKNGGSDEVSTATPTASAIPKAGGGAKLDKGWLPDFVASGGSHASGGVPDPGASAGTTKFLREDASWQEPSGGSSGWTPSTTAKTTAYTAVKNDVVLANGTFTVTLTAAATVGNGGIVVVKNVGAGVVTVDGNGSETIDGALTFELSGQYDSLTLISDGSNWSVI